MVNFHQLSMFFVPGIKQIEVLWVALVGYFIFGVVGAMWHESRILNRALQKVEQIHQHLAKQRWLQKDENVEGMPTKAEHLVATC